MAMKRIHCHVGNSADVKLSQYMGRLCSWLISSALKNSIMFKRRPKCLELIIRCSINHDNVHVALMDHVLYRRTLHSRLLKYKPLPKMLKYNLMGFDLHKRDTNSFN